MSMPNCKPLPQESESDFVTRYHASMAVAIPDPLARTAASIAAWQQSNGTSDEDQRALNQFPDTEFDHVKLVPCWVEHEKTENRVIDGESKAVQIKYGREELAAIAEKCNYRIRDTGDFSAITDGHTSDREEQLAGVKQPELIGFCGPFHLGMIGTENPRWAIFCDEHRFKDRADVYKRNPRRSPEVWLTKEIKDRFFDPIAALGAETPRLDMGIRYCRTSTGQLIEKYSFPGASAVAVPALVSTRPDKHSATENQSMALSEEDVKQITDAIMASAPMQWAMSQMEADTDGDGMDDDGMVPADPDVNPATASATAPGQAAPVATPVEKDAMAKYSRQVANLEKEVERLRAENSRKDRYSKLTAARECHVLDLDKEMKRVENMTDDQFDEHHQTIIDCYQRIPVEADIYVPANAPNGDRATVEKYAKQTARNARDMVIAERRAGRDMSFEDALAKCRNGSV